MDSIKKAPLLTTPKFKHIKFEYSASYVILKADNNWLAGFDIWDLLGIFVKDYKCPLCECNGFQITDEKTGAFSCSICKKSGLGIQLVQHYLSLSYEDSIERVGRLLRIKTKEAFYAA